MGVVVGRSVKGRDIIKASPLNRPTTTAGGWYSSYWRAQAAASPTIHTIPPTLLLTVTQQQPPLAIITSPLIAWQRVKRLLSGWEFNPTQTRMTFEAVAAPAMNGNGKNFVAGRAEVLSINLDRHTLAAVAVGGARMWYFGNGIA